MCIGLILAALRSQKTPIFKKQIDQIHQIQIQHRNFVFALDPKVLRIGGSFIGIRPSIL